MCVCRGDIIVGAKIGEGSEGTVWRGTFMHGPVAIKEMHPKEHRKSTFSRCVTTQVAGPRRG